jgi:long-chain fatty acid transport protein
MKRVTAALAAALAFLPRPALSAGLEVPDNGAEALGRGGAFTAKADDPTALQYNVAGLAAQRGTRVLLDAKLTLGTFAFQRAGRYPDDPRDPSTPWGGRPFPKVVDVARPSPQPFVAVATDLGLFEGVTLAAGVFGPSAPGDRVYPLGVEGAPSPARYDLVASKGLLAFPTLAAAARVLSWLDVGVAVHLAYAKLDVTTVSYSDATPGACKNAEYHACDSMNRVESSGLAVSGALGMMVHPSEAVAIGLNVRGPVTLDTSGTVSAGANLKPVPASFALRLPPVVRAGVRYAFRDHGLETGDVELDGTYEAWHLSDGTGPTLRIPHLSVLSDITATVDHHYTDAFSVRAGGAYNTAHGATLRAGAFYDASVTEPAWTRVDVDTLDKVGVTVGAGYSVGVVRLNAAWAEIFDVDRVVRDGRVRPINGAAKGASVTSTGALLPVVNDGRYSGHAHVISLGVEVTLGGTRAPAR